MARPICLSLRSRCVGGSSALRTPYRSSRKAYLGGLWRSARSSETGRLGRVWILYFGWLFASLEADLTCTSPFRRCHSLGFLYLNTDPFISFVWVFSCRFWYESMSFTVILKRFGSRGELSYSDGAKMIYFFSLRTYSVKIKSQKR